MTSTVTAFFADAATFGEAEKSALGSAKKSPDTSVSFDSFFKSESSSRQRPDNSSSVDEDAATQRSRRPSKKNTCKTDDRSEDADKISKETTSEETAEGQTNSERNTFVHELAEATQENTAQAEQSCDYNDEGMVTVLFQAIAAPVIQQAIDATTPVPQAEASLPDNAQSLLAGEVEQAAMTEMSPALQTRLAQDAVVNQSTESQTTDASASGSLGEDGTTTLASVADETEQMGENGKTHQLQPSSEIPYILSRMRAASNDRAATVSAATAGLSAWAGSYQQAYGFGASMPRHQAVTQPVQAETATKEKTVLTDAFKGLTGSETFQGRLERWSSGGDSQALKLENNTQLSEAIEAALHTEINEGESKRLQIELRTPHGAKVSLALVNRGGEVRVQIGGESPEVVEWLKGQVESMKEIPAPTAVKWLPVQQELARRETTTRESDTRKKDFADTQIKSRHAAEPESVWQRMGDWLAGGKI